MYGDGRVKAVEDDRKRERRVEGEGEGWVRTAEREERRRV